MKKNTCKRIFSTALALVMVLTTFCFADLSLIANAEDSGRPLIEFYVPETIYRNPSGSGYQYFVDSNASGQLSTDPAKTSGRIVFNSDKAFSNLTITRSDSSVGYAAANRVQFETSFSDGNAPGGSVITWTADYTVNGTAYRSMAYSYVYEPFAGMIGSGFYAARKSWYVTHYTEHAAIHLLTGFHSYAAANGNYKWGGAYNNVQTPWEIAIGTDSPNLTSSLGGNRPTLYVTNFLTESSSDDNYIFFQDYGKETNANLTETQNVNTVSAGNFTVDVSRYNNTSQIPNLQAAAYAIGIEWAMPFKVTFETAASTNAYTYPSEFSGFYQSAEHNVDHDEVESRYTSHGISSQIPPADIAAPTANGTSTYQLWVRQNTYQLYDGTLGNVTVSQNDLTRLNVTMVNKSDLRAIFRAASGLAVDCEGSAPAYSTYPTFLSKLSAAGYVLGDPTATASQIVVAANELQSAYDDLADELSEIEEPIVPSAVTFYVPELIYLKPNTENTTSMSAMNAMSEFQYYVDRDTAANGFGLRTGENTTGNIYFNCEQAAKVISLTCEGATVTLSAASSSTGTLECTLNAGIMTTPVQHNGQSTLKWTVAYEIEGETHTATNYTRVYAPYSWAVASGYASRDKSGKEVSVGGIVWITGMHGCGSTGTGDATGGMKYQPMLCQTIDQKSIAYSPSSEPEDYLSWNRNGQGYDGYFNTNLTTGVHNSFKLGAITVDTSRYDTYDIPNVHYGFDYLGEHWYYSGKFQNMTLSYFKDGAENSNEKTVFTARWNEGMSTEMQITGGGVRDGSKAWRSKYSFESPSFAPVSSSTTYLKGYLNIGDKEHSVTITNYLPFSTTTVDKAGLRSTYQNIVNKAYQEPAYTTASWNVFTTALKNAAERLGNPTCTDVSTTDLLNAEASLVPLGDEPPVSAAAIELNIDADLPEVHTGETFRLNIDLVQNTGIAGLLFDLNYDPDVLTLNSVSCNGVLQSGTFQIGGNYAAVPFRIMWDDALAQQNHTETGTIVTCTFAVKETAAVGQTTVSLTAGSNAAIDKDLQRVPLTVTGETLSVILCLSGDCDGDGSVTLKDAIYLARYIAGGWNVIVDEYNADVNKDGSIDNVDLILLKRYLTGGWGVVLI
ncbi:MAG: hypothetical protein IJT44_07315 [Clostridia bacterium]|nr:hypothetical protein [Clostridia bacterium]